MINLLRLAFMIVLLVGVSLVAALLEPQWAHDLCLDSWTEATLQHDLFGSRSQIAELEERHRLIAKRLEAKDEITKDLIRGRLTLFEAAAGFRRLNEQYPLVVVDKPLPGMTEEERLCRQVIEWVRVHLLANPRDASEDFVVRLEHELSRNKRQNGAVQLPAVFASH
jgi:hypothetical protein